MRVAINAILYLLRTGCLWRYIPREGFPPRSTVYNINSQPESWRVGRDPGTIAYGFA
jgi:transposase